MNVRILLRRLVLLGSPLIMVVVGLVHPGGATLEARAAVADMTFFLHLFLIPVFSLIGLAGCWLTERLHSPASMISRSAFALFVICYIALDTFAGIAQGAAFMVAREYPAAQQTALYTYAWDIFTSPLGSGVILGLFIAGTLAWIAGIFGAAIALRQSGVALAPCLLLLMAGVLLIGDHSTAYGSAAFGCFFLAAAWLEFVPQRRIRRVASAT